MLPAAGIITLKRDPAFLIKEKACDLNPWNLAYFVYFQRSRPDTGFLRLFILFQKSQTPT